MKTDSSDGHASPANADVFVSYKSDDRAAVEPLVRALEGEGFSVWWDPTLVPGEQYSRVIRDALDGTRCVVVAWSKRSINSQWVADEAGVGRDRDILVPVSLDGSTPPLGFRQLHTAALSDWNGQPDDPRIKRLLAGVHRLVGRPTGGARTGTASAPRPKRSRTRWFAAAGLMAAIVAAVVAYVAISYLRPNPVATPDSVPPSSASAIPNFSDCKGCPQLIVVPTGSFDMGSQDGEAQRGNDEGPVHTVTIAKVFAAAQYPVTFSDWDLCRAQGGCANLLPSNNHWGGGNQPVINVSWDDAQVYIAWLSKFTGKKYRLLTEAEREYITRAGTTTAFWWGDDITTAQANYDGTKGYNDKTVGLYRQRTLSVNTFLPNPWGFYQVSGNTWDWVQDCYHDSYDNAPTDSSAWLTGNCMNRALRGGSWGSQPRNLRSAARWKLPVGTRDSHYGFRVARDCDADCNI